jgi:hypothetical protein
MPRKPTIPFAPAKSITANAVLSSLRSDPRLRVHPEQPEEAGYAANYICQSNGRTVAVEKTLTADVSVVAADDGSFSAFKHAAIRRTPSYDPDARNFGMNSNLKIRELKRFPPIGFRFGTAGEAIAFLDKFVTLPRLPQLNTTLAADSGSSWPMARW